MTVEPSRRDPALVLLSGGLDSATVLAVARRDGFPCIALSFDYGQRHRAELDAARRIARDQGVVDHRIVRLDADVFRGSALTDDLAVPKDRNEGAMGASIPPTYVPARNTVFLSHALALAEVVGSRDLFIGVNAVDYSGYPDCRPQYIEAFERMANLATRAAVDGTVRLRIHAPLIELPKIRIIQLGLELGVDYSRTHSCYDPDQAGRPCLRCDACLLRMRAFEGLGLTDPLVERLEGRPARSA